MTNSIDGSLKRFGFDLENLELKYLSGNYNKVPSNISEKDIMWCFKEKGKKILSFEDLCKIFGDSRVEEINLCVQSLAYKTKIQIQLPETEDKLLTKIILL
jgi:hypothetical protein